MRITLAAAALFLAVSVTHARPVSYPDGWTLMLRNNGDMRSAHAHYSPTAKTSVGYKFEDWRKRDFSLHALQVNRLVKRWNEKYSQANFYLKSAIGIADRSDAENSHLAGFVGIAADWETRRHFISYESRYTEAGDIDDFYHQSMRLGWAPYQGDYGDLHTWLMVDVRHMPEAEERYAITPLIRLFKGIQLIEIGMSNHGDVTFNYVFRY